MKDGSIPDLPVIVLAFANEQEGPHYLRNLPEELRALERVFPPGVSTGGVIPVFHSNADSGGLQRTFNTFGRRIAILHYGGHADSDHLLLEGPEPQGAAAHAPGLAAYIGQAGPPH